MEVVVEQDPGAGGNTIGLGGGGADGGGTNIPSKNGPHGTYATGGGGGSTGHPNAWSWLRWFRYCCCIRYKILELAGTAKATGGAVYFAGGKTIHTFTWKWRF